MKLIDDNQVFEAAAEELAIRFITRIAICLHEAPEIAFDVTSADAATSDLLFTICFKGAIEFEEQSGIDVNGAKHTPRVAFDTTTSDGLRQVLVGSAQVHGKVDDAQLDEGVKRARQHVNGN